MNAQAKARGRVYPRHHYLRDDVPSLFREMLAHVIMNRLMGVTDAGHTMNGRGNAAVSSCLG